jgi:hypothetical protein
VRAPWDTYGTRSPFALCLHGGGSSSSSAASQATTEQDQRAAADSGSLSATSGATLSNVAVINQSSDPTVITAALQAMENTTAQSLSASGSAFNAATDLGNAAITENAAVSADAIDKWAQVVGTELGQGNQDIQTALSALNNQSASNSALAAQALNQADPTSGALNVIIWAGAAVAIVFFLSRSR